MRETTAIDQLADDYTRALLERSPLLATELGVPGSEHLLDDLSPAGAASQADLDRRTLAALDALTPVDDTDAVTAASLRDRLGLNLESYEAGDHERDLNNIASPIQVVRNVFDLMGQDTAEDWANIAGRMAALAPALAGYAETLRAGVRAGRVAARRQVELAIEETSGLADPATSFFTGASIASSYFFISRKKLCTS